MHLSTLLPCLIAMVSTVANAQDAIKVNIVSPISLVTAIPDKAM